MDTTHLHLIANHVPVFALIFSLILLLTGEMLKNKTLVITAMSGFIVAAVSSVIAFVTGEEAEHLVENIIQAEAFIEQHEEIAKPANLFTIAVGSLAIVSIVFAIIKNKIPVLLKRAVLLVSCIAVVLMTYTAYLGGMIRHTEVRGVNQAAASNTVATGVEDD